METTFISIHDLTAEARILYSSDSVIDILGYTPDEIVNRSAWDFFPADELPYARKFHEKRVQMDKAAVLAYCRVRDKQGGWVGCECCFTIVYDVMIVCTSIYRTGLASQTAERALEAPMVRRLFTSSPTDPRYHMLSHISAKFKQPAKLQNHEPRAALFLNRFTRTLTIMYATSGLQEVIGIPAEAMRGRSFYYCIAENCLQDAVKCLENAKANDSIAYLRFWFRDPRVDDPPPPPDEDSDEEMTTEMSTDMSEDGGVNLHSGSNTSPESASSSHSNAASSDSMEMEGVQSDEQPSSRTSSGDSMNQADTHQAIFGHSLEAQSSASSIAPSPGDNPPPAPTRANPADPIELEAVISCASDGLVVCLRKARPMIPHPTHRPSKPVYQNGLFAAPWAVEPTLPPIEARAGAGFGPAFAPSLGPRGAARASPVSASGPDNQDFMAAIREQAIFAWALTGINGVLAEHAQGKPRGESMPEDGFPVWTSDPRYGTADFERSDSANGSMSSHSGHGGYVNGGQNQPDGVGVSAQFFGDPGLDRASRSGSSTASGNGNGKMDGYPNGNGTGRRTDAYAYAR
ncbi:hypothetical protein BAUCODRAFT_26606 [Baudoinia panamericana UAMH 10762]|uniref:PAS domain-containing protein n=1 Tax=Baudoinia panamericana (strain UAMH 10762) TaxID=717646 RepID=M2MA00_BAUPA|nr:uncharacterized protein BAUCODRAFT_26606 [Baudoinia panamericana UAMH 10762]EMC93291.1 hypothetical protein BAUCODRAFT_26606 [Baudoinia panamericana UAMH 10762]